MEEGRRESSLAVERAESVISKLNRKKPNRPRKLSEVRGERICRDGIVPCALNEDRRNWIQQVISRMRDVGYDHRSMAHDGDRYLLCAAYTVLQRALTSFSSALNNSLQFSVFMEESEMGNDFDRLHILQNERTQRV